MTGYASLSDPRFRYEFKGFTSIINQITELVLLHHNKHGNYNVIIQDEQITRFFDVKHIYDGDETYNLSDIFFDKFLNGGYNDAFNAHKLIDKSDLSSKNPFNYMSLKTELETEFTEQRNKLFGDKQMIGVQIRGTDKKMEIAPPSDKDLVNKIKEFISDKKDYGIFLSTDDAHYVNLLTDNFSGVIRNTSSRVSVDGKPLHFGGDRYITNKEVLLDVYLLSKCDHIMYTFSNVGYLAMAMSDNAHKELINLNT